MITCALNILALPMGIDTSESYTMVYATDPSLYHHSLHREANHLNIGDGRVGNPTAGSLQNTHSQLTSVTHCCNPPPSLTIPDIITCHVTVNSSVRNQAIGATSAKRKCRKEKRKILINKKFLLKNEKIFRSNKKLKSYLGIRQTQLIATDESSNLGRRLANHMLKSFACGININKVIHFLKQTWMNNSFLCLCVRYLQQFLIPLNSQFGKMISNTSKLSEINKLTSSTCKEADEEIVSYYKNLGVNLRKIADDFQSNKVSKSKPQSTWTAELTFTTAAMWSASMLLIGVTSRILFRKL